MIAWSGRGYVIAFANLIGAGIALALGLALHLNVKSKPDAAAAMAAWGVFSGILAFIFVRIVESRPPRTLIEKSTGRELTIPSSAGTFGFLPAKHFAWLNPLFGVLLAAIIWYADWNPFLERY